MIREEVGVKSNKCLAPNFYRLTFTSSFIASHALPGQFLHIRVRQQSLEILLRRPFSVHRVSGNNVSILYKVVGKGTELLSRAAPGDYLDILGPLGNGFSISKDTNTYLLVAGGIGISPLLALADELVKERGHGNIHLLLGAQTKEALLCMDEFKSLHINISLATKDGTKGDKGLITKVLDKILKEGRLNQPVQLFACGPRDMLKVCADIAARFSIQCQVSLEEMLACGVGACLGCAVKTRSDYKRVCKEGPVFDSREILWEERC